jgi:bacterial/archaeal transporter family protein
MRSYMLYAILAGVAWGVGGYFEKIGLHQMRVPPIVGITIRTLVAVVILGIVSLPAWKSVSIQAHSKYLVMIILGGGLLAGSLGMWSFYSALARSENLGITLATAFACAPLAGTVVGLIRRDQRIDIRIAVGLVAVILGLVILHLSQVHHK